MSNPATPEILLVDNGSSRAPSTLALRRIAAALAERANRPVHPVSLLHADRVPAAELNGAPADTLEPYLRRALSAGRRAFLVVPLFFGPSQALTRFVPETAAALAAELGPCRIRVAPELCPLPAGEPRLADILADQVWCAAAADQGTPHRVVLVDHGSPLPEVTAVRRWLARALAVRLGPECALHEAVMERRAGPAYDFNGDLLARVLDRLGIDDPETPIVLAMLFLAPGRHAGPMGDVAGIAAAAEAQHPGLRICPSPLVGAHPGLVNILADRLATGLAAWEAGP